MPVRQRSALLALVLALTLVLPAAGVADEHGTTYSAPYELGPQGGDMWNYIDADEEEGRIFVGRAYPLYNPLSCAPGGGYAKFEIVHELGDEPLTEVSATFSEAVVDSYAFVTLAVRTADGEWIASTRERGPLLLDGSLTAEPFAQPHEDDDHVVVQFGIEIASACPHVNGGTALFDAVTVR